MAPQPISTKEALSYGWAKMKDNLGIFVPLCLVGWFFAALQGIINRWHGDTVVLRWLLSPILTIVMLQVSIAWIRIALRVHDGKPADLSELTRVDAPELFNFLIGSLVYGLVVACGLALLIVPGVLWAVKYSLFGFLIVDQDLDPLSALRRSAELTKPVRKDLLLLGLAVIGVNILGALALGIGLFVTAPASMMAAGHVYRQLLRGAVLGAQQTPEAPLPDLQHGLGSSSV